MTRWSRRERLLATARALKLGVPLSISDDELENLINAQPATEGQLGFIEEMLRHLQLTPPAGMTYGHARKVIATAKEGLNEYAIRVLDLHDGDVREWEDAYYLIHRVYGDAQLHKLLVQRVTLHRAPGAEHATTTAAGKRHRMDPADLLYLSTPIDLATWSPGDAQSSWPQRREDEPPF